MKKITILSPVNNEIGNIKFFYSELVKTFESFKNRIEFEILFINDGSTDNTLIEIQNLNMIDNRVKYISLSKNFGYQAALICGLKNINANAVIIITAAMTDPPSLINAFIFHWEEGYKLVYGRRKLRPEPKWLTGLRNSFYTLLKYVADTDIILNMSEFCLFDEQILKSILESKNQYPFVRSDISHAGFSQLGIDYNIQPRHSGKSHYNLFRMTKFAIGGILSISTYPLRLIVYLSFFLVGLNCIKLLVEFFGLYDLSFMNNLNNILYSLSIMFFSIYLARIYKNIASKPIYVIDDINSKF